MSISQSKKTEDQKVKRELLLFWSSDVLRDWQILVHAPVRGYFAPIRDTAAIEKVCVPGKAQLDS
jgi:hypothetical protein